MGLNIEELTWSLSSKLLVVEYDCGFLESYMSSANTGERYIRQINLNSKTLDIEMGENNGTKQELCRNFISISDASKLSSDQK